MQRFFRNIWSMQRFVSRQPLLPNPLVAECCEKANAGTHLLSLSNHCFGSDFFFKKRRGAHTLVRSPSICRKSYHRLFRGCLLSQGVPLLPQGGNSPPRRSSYQVRSISPPESFRSLAAGTAGLFEKSSTKNFSLGWRRAFDQRMRALPAKQREGASKRTRPLRHTMEFGNQVSGRSLIAPARYFSRDAISSEVSLPSPAS